MITWTYITTDSVGGSFVSETLAAPDVLSTTTLSATSIGTPSGSTKEYAGNGTWAGAAVTALTQITGSTSSSYTQSNLNFSFTASGSGTPGTFAGQTSATASSSESITSTSTTSFSLGIWTSETTTASSSYSSSSTTSSSSYSTSTVLQTSSSYADVTTASASTTLSYNTTTSTSAQSYFLAVKTITCYLPDPGEVAWVATGVGISLVSALASHTASFSLGPNNGGTANIAGAYGVVTETSSVSASHSAALPEILSSSYTQTAQFIDPFSFESWFSTGTITITITEQYSSSYSTSVASSSSSSTYATTYGLSYSFPTTTSSSYSSIAFLMASSEGNDFFSTAITGTYSKTYSSSLTTTATGILATGSPDASGTAGGATSAATYSGNYYVNSAIEVLMPVNSYSIVIRTPPIAYRAAPNSSMAQQLMLGSFIPPQQIFPGSFLAKQYTSTSYTYFDGTTTVSETDTGFTPIQTCPMQSTGTLSWTDSSSVSYTASISGLSWSITSQTGTNASDTASEMVSWSTSGSVTSSLSSIAEANFIGSGNYGTDYTAQINSMLLGPGAYAVASGTTQPSVFTAISETGYDSVRGIAEAAAAINGPGSNAPLVEQRTDYNQ